MASEQQERGAGRFSDADAAWTRESGWDRIADNPLASAFGIPEELRPGERGGEAR